jgi:hypothetical protein
VAIERSNMTYIEEDNYSILSKDTDVWMGKLPFNTGHVFPTPDIEERARISATNRMIYQNKIEEIYSNIISIFPEIDPMYGWQIREIVTELPYFNKTVNHWKGLIAGEPPVVDGDDTVDIQLNEVIENSNFASIITNEVGSRFMDIISAYRVDVDINGKPTVIAIEAKNLICYVSRIYTNSIEVNVIFNIYTTEDDSEFIEFIEYHYNGKIKKTVFEYENGAIGSHLEDLDEESEAFSGKYKMSPIVVFRHNTTANEIYGTDQFRYWSASILGAMRELQNIFRLSERTREIIREVPDNAIKKDPVTGASTFINRGTVGVPTGQKDYPEVKYKVPEIRMDEAVKAFEKAIKSVSIDTNLGPVFFDLEKLGTNLSAKSIEAALYPTKLEAKRITTEMTPGVKELVVKLCALADIDLSSTSKFSIRWFDGFPKDVKEYTDAIQNRLGNKPSISLEDAIISLDKVSSRIAIQKAREIRQENNVGEAKKDTVSADDTNEDVEDMINDSSINNLNTHDIEPTAGVGNKDSGGVVGDTTLWETQMINMPRDIPQGHSKGVNDSWIKRKLRQNR